MNTITEKITRAVTATQKRIADGVDRLTEQPESGLDDAAWKVIWLVVGGAAALTFTGLIIAWATGYINTKLSGF